MSGSASSSDSGASWANSLDVEDVYFSRFNTIPFLTLNGCFTVLGMEIGLEFIDGANADEVLRQEMIRKVRGRRRFILKGVMVCGGGKNNRAIVVVD